MFDFKNKKEILDLLNNVDEKKQEIKVKELLQDLKTLKKGRKQFYLTKKELKKIIKWKLRNQFGRQQSYRDKNTNKNIKAITQTAFNIHHKDDEFETELKLKILMTLNGVGGPVASAILTICYPDKYAVIDRIVWNQLYNNKFTFTTNKYLKYLKEIRRLAKKYKLTPQEIDLAIWQLGKKSH